MFLDDMNDDQQHPADAGAMPADDAAEHHEAEAPAEDAGEAAPSVDHAA